MTLRISLIICCLLLTPYSLSSQEIPEHQIDTLQSIISRSNEAYDVYNYKNVIKHGATLIKKGKEFNNNYYTFLGYDILGGAYSELDDTIQGRRYSEKALEIARTSGSDSLISWATMNLGIFYSNKPQTYQKAIRFFEESIAINEKNNELAQVYLTYINLAWTYLDHGEMDKAYAILKKAVSISNTIDVYSSDKRYIELLLGKYHLAKKEYIPAMIKLESVSKEADKDSLTDLALEAYENLAIVYHRKKDYQNAFESLNKYNHYRKKAFTEEKIEETEKAKAKFDLKEAQKNLNVALREKQYSDQLIAKSKSLTTILVAATIILLLALLGFFLFFKTRKKYIRKLKTKNQELRIAKEKAEKLSKVKTRFLSTVSHELRTPLYGVIGIATLLKEDEKLEAYREDLESLKFSADYLLALINDVLLLSKVDAEAIKLSQNPFKVDFLIQNIVHPFEFSLQKNNNKLHLRIDKSIPNTLIGDSIRLSQILINLIGNAVKFNQNGNIWLTLDHIKVTNKGLHQIRFTIKDDGPGIPLDKQKIIFEEFSQIEHGNHDYKGTGLGLTIVKKLLKVYKSEIHLKSKPGKGSEFSFSLKLKKDADKIAQKKLQNAPKYDLADTFKNTDLHFLIVDDNRINQKITQKILRRYHITSSLANDGRQAIKMNKSKEFDMIMMDINMPKINGMEAAKMIRKLDKKTPIIALTAVELDEMRNQILNSGISDIIHKPYDIQEFLNIILKNLPSKLVDVSN